MLLPDLPGEGREGRDRPLDPRDSEAPSGNGGEPERGASRGGVLLLPGEVEPIPSPPGEGRRDQERSPSGGGGNRRNLGSGGGGCRDRLLPRAGVPSKEPALSPRAEPLAEENRRRGQRLGRRDPPMALPGVSRGGGPLPEEKPPLRRRGQRGCGFDGIPLGSDPQPGYRAGEGGGGGAPPEGRGGRGCGRGGSPDAALEGSLLP